MSLSTQLSTNLVLLENALANLTNECMGNTSCMSVVPTFQAGDYNVNISINVSIILLFSTVFALILSYWYSLSSKKIALTTGIDM